MQQHWADCTRSGAAAVFHNDDGSVGIIISGQRARPTSQWYAVGDFPTMLWWLTDVFVLFHLHLPAVSYRSGTWHSRWTVAFPQDGVARAAGSIETYTQYSEFGNAQFKTSIEVPAASIPSEVCRTGSVLA